MNRVVYNEEAAKRTLYLKAHLKSGPTMDNAIILMKQRNLIVICLKSMSCQIEECM